MSMESLLLVFFLVLLPLLQSIAERRRAASAAGAGETLPREDGGPAEPVRYTLDPAPNLLPSSQRPASQPAVVPKAEPRRHGDVQRTRGAPRVTSSPARDRLRQAVPRDRESLRRGMLLVEILGPPRSLDNKLE
jgi:hypothetical protein